MGNRFRLLVNEVEAIKPKNALPKLPVARVLWKPMPDMKTGCAAWIFAGGAHHTCFSQNLTSNTWKILQKWQELKLFLLIKETNLYELKNELRWNEIYYHLNNDFVIDNYM